MPKVEIEASYPAWFLPLLEPRRYKGASGGRAAGRSHAFATLAVEEMATNPDLRFVCIREVQKALRFSAKSLVESKIEAMGVGHLFEVLRSEIRRRGGDGIMIFEGMQDHTVDSIKSLEAFDRAWIEEAHSISLRSWNILRPTIRAPGSEIWASWNPENPSDPVDQFFNADVPGAIHVKANYYDNPFLPEVMRQEAEMMRQNDPEAYEHIWEGGYFLGRSGRVYSSFVNRPWPVGNIDETVQDTGAELLVGMDFNVNPMSAVLGVRVADELHILDALEVPTSHTAEVAEELRSRFPGRTIVVCPDPSGRARKTSAAGETDFTILERYGFEVRAPRSAPLVRDRVNNTNTMLHDTETGRRRVKIHPDAESLILALSNLVYKEGTSIPDKRSGFDHPTDALGYLLWEEFNVLKAESVAESVFTPFV